MKKIEIDGYDKNESRGRWTEESYGNITLKKGTKVYHYSSSKIDKFAEVETCFFVDPYQYNNKKEFPEEQLKTFKSFKQYEYTLVVLEDIEVENFGDDEVRIDLEESQRFVVIYYTRMTNEYITSEIDSDGTPIRYFDIKNIK